jgi:hypothetical protein
MASALPDIRRRTTHQQSQQVQTCAERAAGEAPWSLASPVLRVQQDQRCSIQLCWYLLEPCCGAQGPRRKATPAPRLTRKACSEARPAYQ